MCYSEYLGSQLPSYHSPTESAKYSLVSVENLNFIADLETDHNDDSYIIANETIDLVIDIFMGLIMIFCPPIFYQ